MTVKAWIRRDSERDSYGLTKVLTGIHLVGLRETKKTSVGMTMYQPLYVSYIVL
jgi:hypothetical protein